ncbi:hypothetical protein [Actinomadura sp. DC4]|uniref:hypothetical protein n=1 Tax=Actinomadura sp. DC4 TaxID=3055069 RepID=UPI0025B1F7B8|nr:hypothetical protein [Actinomadura sp. DC4]MDN3359681.1 hypothetical protein [Actinomadura sp. DC4]
MGVTSAALIAGAMAPAYASAIPNGHVQICAQGDYASYITFPNRSDYSSTVVSPGQCWYQELGGNSWEPINVYNEWGGYLATEWYNGSSSGIGIGTEGSGGSEWVTTW